LALPGVGSVQLFVICTTEDGRFLNAVPHCYRVDQDGRIADDGNGGLSDIEIGSYQTLMMQRTLTGKEQAELDALRERLCAPICRLLKPPAN
jgi:hypothetical protein